MSYSQEFQDILEGIDEAQLLAEIGEEELARQADMLDLLQKKEATVEDGQLVHIAPAPLTPHPSHHSDTPHTHTPHSHTPCTPLTPYRKRSSSTLTGGGLSKFFEPESEERVAIAAAEEEMKEGHEGEGQESEDDEPFDCSAEVSCTPPNAS